jgi:oligopeptide/dipeptide ABC transporter ATP-binding protein
MRERNMAEQSTNERKKLVEVKGLKTYFYVEGMTAKAVDGVDFHIYENEVFGLVGESGCGKSVTALSILRLIPNPPGEIVEGEIRFRGQNLMDLTYEEMRKIRGKDISMIFQEPMTSLNPVFSIGWQVMEAIRFHQKIKDKKELRARAVEMLDLVGIPSAEKRLKNYPHQFSGGMRQRVMIAMALACSPALLIADEPTTALDVTIQAQILELMLNVKEETGDAAVMLITHDLAVVAETCQRVAVMYGGKIQEVGDAVPLFGEPLHPYTRGLLKSLPRPDMGVTDQKRLSTIEGIVPSIMAFPPGCKFNTRCDVAIPLCATEEPELLEVEPGRLVRCHLRHRDAGLREIVEAPVDAPVEPGGSPAEAVEERPEGEIASGESSSPPEEQALEEKPEGEDGPGESPPPPEEQGVEQ